MTGFKYDRSKIGYRVLAVGIALVAVTSGLYLLFRGAGGAVAKSNTVRVLSYSAFVNSWGPGPAIAEEFRKIYGVNVELQDAGDAGLILKKLDLFPADVVVGLDQLTIFEAREKRKWRTFNLEPDLKEIRWREDEFLPFDWGPMAFVYRKGEIEPPKSLDDLLDPRFKGAIALEDPRTSTPGLQFLFWVLDEKGIEPGFDYLAKLKGSLHSVSGSWSAAYGLFTKKQAKLAFSYLTSPVYHWTEDKDESYQPAVFESGHPVQIEYSGVPETCQNCEGGRLFARFLLRPEIQKIIMEKNYMMPVLADAAKGTPFEKLPEAKIRKIETLPTLLKNRDALLERWRQLGL